MRIRYVVLAMVRPRHILQLGVLKLRREDRVSLIMQQGQELSRPGLVEIEAENGPAGLQLWLGGDCKTSLKGRLWPT
jgi:predicted PhzF superfamily epimerase YddE/YHI9